MCSPLWVFDFLFFLLWFFDQFNPQSRAAIVTGAWCAKRPGFSAYDTFGCLRPRGAPGTRLRETSFRRPTPIARTKQRTRAEERMEKYVFELVRRAKNGWKRKCLNNCCLHWAAPGVGGIAWHDSLRPTPTTKKPSHEPLKRNCGEWGEVYTRADERKMFRR